MKKKSVRGLAAVCTLMLLLIFSVAAYADTPTATDELDAVQQYVDEKNITFEDEENGVHYYLRAAYVMDVAASQAGMADSKYLDRFNESYGDFERVYFMEYAYTYGANPMPNCDTIAIGVRTDGTMERCPTFNDMRARTFDFNWCEGTAVENILDRTLAEAMAE